MSVLLLKRVSGRAHTADLVSGDTAQVPGKIVIAGSSLAGTEVLRVQGETQIEGTLHGTLDGTGLIIGIAGASASTGSTIQIGSFTTTQRGNLVPASGMEIYNTTLGWFQSYNGIRWGDDARDNNFQATSTPSVSDDVSTGYQPGSFWVNTTSGNQQAYTCLANTSGNAIWALSTLTSGVITSGMVGSGAVQGYISSGRNIASGTVGGFDFGSGAVTAGTVGSGAILSGNIASGSIGHFHLSSGAVTSGNIGNNAVVSGSIASGSISQFALSSGAVNSGQIASGAVEGSLGGGAFNIASGTVGPNDLGSGAIRSGVIASGQISQFALASGAVNSGQVGSGSIIGVAGGGARNIASGTISTFDIASGAIRSGQIGDGAVVSGSIASGVITSIALASGDIISTARAIIDDFSAAGAPLTTQEIISGFVAVAISQSGNLQIAMPSVSGRMPAVGIAVSGALSGQAASFWTEGFFQVSSGLINFSGSLGEPVFIAGSGQLGVISGGFLSGGYGSGDIQQFAGTVINSGGIRISIGRPSEKASPWNVPSSFWISSGDISSGQISQFHLASGTVNSGQVGNAAVVSGSVASGSVSQFAISSGAINSGQVSSGAIVGAIGAGRSIASGSIAHFDFGSGAILSGDIASGQIGFNHLASGSVGSGALASGQVTNFKLGSGAVQSGAIASGSVGQFHLASGAVGSGDLGNSSVTSGSIASGQISQFALASGAVNSGQIGNAAVVSGSFASGIISQFALASGAVNSGQLGSGAILGAVGGGARNIASGTIGPNDLGSGSVLSGVIASGQVGQFHISSGAVTSGRLGVTGTPDGTNYLRDDFTWAPTGGGAVSSGSISSGDIASGTIQGFFGVTRHIASGTIGVFDFGSGAIVAGTVGSGAVVSGNIASGQIGFGHLANASVQSGTIASGIIVDYSRIMQEDRLTTAEAISGTRAVALSTSGNIIIAMANFSGRMPAVGVVVDNVTSGQSVKVYRQGLIFANSNVSGAGFNFSGHVGSQIYVDISGTIISSPPTSGQVQVLGTANSVSGAILGTTQNDYTELQTFFTLFANPDDPYVRTLGNNAIYGEAQGSPQSTNEVQYTRVYLTKGRTYTKMRAFITSGANGSRQIEFGIYDQATPASPTGTPNNKVANTAANTPPNATTGYYDVNLSSSYTVPISGFYWLAFQCDNSSMAFSLSDTKRAAFSNRREETPGGFTLPSTAGATTQPQSAIIYVAAVE